MLYLEKKIVGKSELLRKGEGFAGASVSFQCSSVMLVQCTQPLYVLLFTECGLALLSCALIGADFPSVAACCTHGNGEWCSCPGAEKYSDLCKRARSGVHQVCVCVHACVCMRDTGFYAVDEGLPGRSVLLSVAID